MDNFFLNKEVVAYEDIDTSELALSGISVAATSITCVAAVESASVDNALFIGTTSIDYNIDSLTPGTESFMSKIISVIKHVFSKVLGFLKNVGNKILNVFKKLWRFISGLFTDKNKGGGGGGSATVIKKKIEDRKEAIDKEVKEMLNIPASDTRVDKATIMTSSARKSIVKALINNPTFFMMPLGSDAAITAEDIVNYAKTITSSFGYINETLLMDVLSDTYNPTAAMLTSKNSNKATIIDIVGLLIKKSIAHNEHLTKNGIPAASTVFDYNEDEAIKMFRSVENGISVITTAAASLTSKDMTNTVIQFNNTVIPVPANIQTIFDNEDNGLVDGNEIKRILVSVGKAKASYLCVRHDTTLDESINASVELINDAFNPGGASHDIDDVVLELSALLSNISKAYSINVKSYEYIPDIDEAKLTDMINNMVVRNSNVETALNDGVALIKNIETTVSNTATINKALISKYEKNMAEAGLKLIELKETLEAAAINTDKERDKLSKIITNFSSVATNTGKSLVTPIQEFLGVSMDGSNSMRTLTSVVFEDNFDDSKVSQYSLFNILVDLYAIKRIEDTKLMSS